jgi:hypothetical protein
LSDKPLPLGENVDNKPTGQDDTLPEKKIRYPLSSLDLPEEKKIAYVKENINPTFPSISLDLGTVNLNVENTQSRKIIKIQKGIKSKQTISSPLEVKLLQADPISLGVK